MSVSSRQAWSTEGSRTARDKTLRPSSKKNGRDVVPQGGPRLPFLYLPLSDPPTCEPSLRAELRPSTTFLHQDSCPDTPSFQSTPSTNELTSEMEVGRFLIPYACFSHSYMQISQFVIKQVPDLFKFGYRPLWFQPLQGLPMASLLSCSILSPILQPE